MQETPQDLQQLQTLLDSSIARAQPFLRKAFQMPEHSLSARQIVHRLQGIATLALATVTAKGEPVFYKGRFYIPTVRSAARTRHIQARPAVSLSYFSGEDLALIVHGHAVIVAPGDADFDPLEAIHREANGSSVQEWGKGGEGVFLRVEADVFYTFARYPEQFPED